VDSVAYAWLLVFWDNGGKTSNIVWFSKYAKIVLI